VFSFSLGKNIRMRTDKASAMISYLSAYHTDKKMALNDALRRADGNRSEAARILGISRVSVWKQMKKFNISLDGSNGP
jgi:transcriptional regulator of acetoin/glycerol metabolism